MAGSSTPKPKKRSAEQRDRHDGMAGGKSPVSPASSKGDKKKKEKKKSKRSKGEKYTGYIYKMLKSIHPQMGMATKAMMIMNSFMTDAFERIAMEAGRLCTYNRKETLTDREICTAVRLGLPGELASHAMEDGQRAVNRFIKNSKDGQ
eukprot:Lankesteria_metandrocarpae@DN1400_c0_g1_i1.p1